MFLRLLFAIALLSQVVVTITAINEELTVKLDKTIAATKSIIDSIYSEWQIEKYPNFLKSCFMHKLSWELMKLKFERKIMSALSPKSTEPTKFVISFTGR